MDQRFLVAISRAYYVDEPTVGKLLNQKKLFPIGGYLGFVADKAELTVKLRNPLTGNILAESASVHLNKDTFCLKLKPQTFIMLSEELIKTSTTLLVFEGSAESPRMVLYFDRTGKLFDDLQSNDPTLRLEAYGLPPSKITPIESPLIAGPLYTHLCKLDQDLFSVRAQQFLRNPHILTYLFSHVMSLKSKDHINYISNLRIISDHLREFLRPRIRKIERNHSQLWGKYYGENISFLDGGMSRIVSLPGTEPMGIRVGIYTVKPGETDLEKREKWELSSYVIGDVLNDSSIINTQFYNTDTKRLQETARYILEPLTALKYIRETTEKSCVIFLHGPLQNAFETYDELDPYFIPGVDYGYLADNGITEDEIEKTIQHLPKDHRGQLIWNGCIAVYAYIMKKVSESNIPMVGVVERARSTAVTSASLGLLVHENIIPDSTRRELTSRIKKYEIDDEFLFGCILEEGEYLEPIHITKNVKRRAHDNWQPVIEQFPSVYCTMLKSSPNNFPYRVEFNRVDASTPVHDIASLLYHTSLLLPNYAFPVGIDIVDKYAKIPDWLSKGISARLTASILSKVLQTGNDRLLCQVRQLLARSPRDFFFRPKA
jgi:hypothetical protein